MRSPSAGVKENPYLRCLYVYGVGMEDAGAMALAEALSANSSIDKIFTQYNGICPEGAEALVEVCLARNIHMGGNTVGGNPFSDPDRYPDESRDLRRRFQDVHVGGDIGVDGKAEILSSHQKQVNVSCSMGS